MPESLLAVVVDCHDALSQASWWAEVLGHVVWQRNTGEYQVSDPTSRGTPMYFMNVEEGKVVKNRVHVDITTDATLEDAVARLTSAGAVLLDLRQDSAELANPDVWAVMADPEGNEFCVLRADTVTGMA
jgi:hypothetical protein